MAQSNLSRNYLRHIKKLEIEQRITGNLDMVEEIKYNNLLAIYWTNDEKQIRKQDMMLRGSESYRGRETSKDS